MQKEKILCTRCVLSSDDDPNISFDDQNICNHCRSYDQKQSSKSNEEPNSLENIVSKIKSTSARNKYDCIVGISGGVDSSYVAYLCHEHGLNPLIVHYDNGWNSETASLNIQNILNKLNFDLYTHVNDWKEFRDLQRSFFKASVIDIELLTDQGIFALLYKQANKHNIKYIITGHNSSSESILPKSWYHWKSDVLNIKSIHKKFGTRKIKTYPMLGFFEKLYLTRFKKIQTIDFLDYIHYDREKAKKQLMEKVGWQDYGGKHHESVFTRFYQGYILPVKFGVDKRKAHLSSLINSQQISREEAFEQLRSPIYDPKLIEEDKEYVEKKLGFSQAEFDELMQMPPIPHLTYDSYFKRHYKYELILSKILNKIRKPRSK